MFEPAGVRTLLQLRTSYPARPSTSAGLPGSSRAARAGGTSIRPYTAPPNMALTAPSRTACCDETRETIEENDYEWWDYADPQSLLNRTSSMISELQEGWVRERKQQLGELCNDLEEAYGVRLSQAERDALLRGSTEEIVDTLMTPDDAGKLDEDSRLMADAAELVVMEAQQHLEASRCMRMRMQDLVAASGEIQEDRCMDVVEESDSNSYLEDLQNEVLRLKAVQGVRDELRGCMEAHALSAESVEQEAQMAAPNLDAFDAWLCKLHEVAGSDASTSLPCAAAAETSPSGHSEAGDSTVPAASPAQDGVGIAAAPTPRSGCQDPSFEGACGAELRGGIIHPAREASLPGPCAGGDGNLCGAEPGCAVGDLQKQLDEILSEFDEIDRIRDNICKITFT